MFAREYEEESVLLCDLLQSLRSRVQEASFEGVCGSVLKVGVRAIAPSLPHNCDRTSDRLVRLRHMNHISLSPQLLLKIPAALVLLASLESVSFQAGPRPVVVFSKTGGLPLRLLLPIFLPRCRVVCNPFSKQRERASACPSILNPEVRFRNNRLPT